jgi:hypothetical protein
MNLNIILIIIILFLIYQFGYTTKTNSFYRELFTNIQTIQTIGNSKLSTPVPINLSKYFPSGLVYKTFDKEQIKPNGKIFLSVASYRDPQCPLTILDAISKASKPENLVIVVCQQNDLADTQCKLPEEKTRGATVKYIVIPHTEAKGPCWARFCINQMWDGEEYYLQIDSHTRFVDSWDTKCIQGLKQAQGTKGDNLVCLTNYVSTFNINTGEIEINPLRGPMYIESVDQTDGFDRYNSKYSNTTLIAPVESKGWSGCFAFGPSQMLIDAPYDPYTPFLFFGEEMDIFARLYTRGWLMYVPHIPICFTIFDRSYRKTFWEHPDQASIVPWSKIRLYERFGILSKESKEKIPPEVLLDKEKFSLGTVKTFEQFAEYCAN